MIEIRLLTEKDEAAVRLPNEAFSLFGRLQVSHDETGWHATEERFSPEDVKELTFPDENYEIEKVLKEGLAVGAFDGKNCVGVAIFTHDWLKYLYLSDLKVASAYRGQGIAEKMLALGLKKAKEKGYAGIWTIGQDNNLAACRFYLKMGFEIGGLDTLIYRHTKQADKANVHFYWEGEK